MSRNWYTTATSVSILASAVLPLGANAQQEESTIEEIVVTAQKREERLLDVALSLAVINETTLEDAGVSQVDDIVLLTPGLDFSQTLGRQNTNPLIRGVAPTFLTDPTVVVLIDGFSLGFTRLVNNSMLSDLERIEVLKGPQATLYGRNALGGVINYITKKPSDTFGASFSGEYGSYQSYQLSGLVTGPIAPDSLYGRITVATRRTEGFIDNQFDGAEDVNGERDYNVRGSLRFVPTDDLEMDLAVTYGEGEDECGDCSHIANAYNRDDPNRFLEIGAGNLDFNDTARTTNMSFLGGYDREDLTTTLNTTYTQPGYSVTSITGYGYIDAVLMGDSNGPSVGSFIPGVLGYTVPSEIDGWSEELRIASSADGDLTWLAGLYAYKSTSDSSLLFGPVALSSGRREITNYAGFANAEYALSDVFSVDLGLRYDYEKQEFLNKLSGGTSSRTANELLPRISFSFEPSEEMHWYFTASRGYHAGGFNDPRAPEPEFDSEYIWNYEIGMKGLFLDNRMHAQVTAFYIDWDGQQINQTVNIPGGSSVTYIANVGRSRITGLEASTQWAVSDAFFLNAGIALMDSELEEFEDPVVAPRFGLDPDLSGNELPYAPNVSATLSGQYIAPLGAGDWQMRLRADMRYMGERFFGPVNLIEADSYLLVNVYAGIENDRYEVGLFADNLFDEEYLAGGTLPDFVFPPEVTIGDPLIWGIRGGIRFGSEQE